MQASYIQNSPGCLHNQGLCEGLWAEAQDADNRKKK